MRDNFLDEKIDQAKIRSFLYECPRLFQGIGEEKKKTREKSGTYIEFFVYHPS